MEEIDRFIGIVDRLLGDRGCPWDKEQTMRSLQPFLLEELHELLEAIDLGQTDHIMEEAGDLFHGLIFLAKIAEKEHLFTLEDVFNQVAEKMIRRHPHIFGEESVSTSDEVLRRWQEIKKEEKENQNRTSLLDGIPPAMSLLLKAQKMQKKLSKTSFDASKLELETDEEIWAQKLWSLVQEASIKKIPAEDAFRRYLSKVEKTFREEEKKG